MFAHSLRHTRGKRYHQRNGGDTSWKSCISVAGRQTDGGMADGGKVNGRKGRDVDKHTAILDKETQLWPACLLH